MSSMRAGGNFMKSLRLSAAAPTSPAPLPSPMRTNFINRSPITSSISESGQRACFRHNLSITDCGFREYSFVTLQYRPDTMFNGASQRDAPTAAQKASAFSMAASSQAGAAKVSPQAEDTASWLTDEASNTYGDRANDDKVARWRPKHYGKVTFGPRNYPYPISRWLGRRFQMKKHKILKRMRFRRYKLAAVANLPFAKMIRVGMLPELKSSKAKKGDDIDMGLGAQLVKAAKSASGGKEAGRRSRPKSKYQV